MKFHGLIEIPARDIAIARLCLAIKPSTLSTRLSRPLWKRGGRASAFFGAVIHFLCTIAQLLVLWAGWAKSTNMRLMTNAFKRCQNYLSRLSRPETGLNRKYSILAMQAIHPISRLCNMLMIIGATQNSGQKEQREGKIPWERFVPRLILMWDYWFSKQKNEFWEKNDGRHWNILF